MSNITLFLIAFALTGAVLGWLARRSWWAPTVGAIIGAAVFVALFFWALSKTDIG